MKSQIQGISYTLDIFYVEKFTNVEIGRNLTIHVAVRPVELGFGFVPQPVLSPIDLH
jgi:hypothetical protein